MSDGYVVGIGVRRGCFCNLFHCEHQFRIWSMLWYQGIRRKMPITLIHPFYTFKSRS